MTLIIAEAGVNHNGDINLAKRLVDVAKDSGADVIKFQTFRAEDLVTSFAKKANYQIKDANFSENQFEMLKKLELKNDEFRDLKLYCDNIGIEFLSTGFDFESLDFLVDLGIKRIKIPSGELTNLPYLEKAAQYGLPVIMSTGMSSMHEIKQSMKAMISKGLSKEKLTVLHCTTSYPAPIESVNLLAMQTIKNELGVSVGYSDHSINIEVPIAAVAMGSEVIEKHFTISRDLDGPDHLASLEPDELVRLVNSIRNTEIALGNPIKKITGPEKENLNLARKSIVAKKDIKRGETLSSENMTTKRPANGISPMLWHDLNKTLAKKDFKKDDLITK
ncbi:N-acetylneuraminate synthase [Candidatus Pseudothioglobus singularis]|nr:N-acetylneuraminate synthase [Candidatus Pseudothioglobus singularis]